MRKLCTLCSPPTCILLWGSTQLLPVIQKGIDSSGSPRRCSPLAVTSGCLCAQCHTSTQEQIFSMQLPHIISAFPTSLFGTKIIWEAKGSLSGNSHALSRSTRAAWLWVLSERIEGHWKKWCLPYVLILVSKHSKLKVNSLGLILKEFTLLKKWGDSMCCRSFYEVVLASHSITQPLPAQHLTIFQTSKYADVFHFSSFFWPVRKVAWLAGFCLLVCMLRCGCTWQLCVKKLMRQS